MSVACSKLLWQLRCVGKNSERAAFSSLEEMGANHRSPQKMGNDAYGATRELVNAGNAEGRKLEGSRKRTASELFFLFCNFIMYVV